MQPSQRIGVGIVALGVLIAAGIVWYGAEKPRASTPERADPPRVASATTEDGVQYVDIVARGGYTPRTTQAVAGTSTIIRLHTEGTYDCSSAVVIPALGFEAVLGPNGVREVPVPADKAHGTLEGLCSMGMYRFSVVFE